MPQRLWLSLCICALFAVTVTAAEAEKQEETVKQPTLPVVLWHGMGDTCCGRTGIGDFKRYLEETYGVFVYSIGFGSYVQDVAAGYIGSVNAQVERVCKKLKEISELQSGYSAIGFSQGGQFLRAVAQRCNHEGPKMVNLITLGGQHQGVMGFPGCDAVHDPSITCQIMQRAIRIGVYLPRIQNTIIQAQYYKDPFKFKEYLAHSQFLKDINNDGTTKNPLYRRNLASLEQFVMVKFQKDEKVIPPESAWFWYYNGSQLLTMREQKTYTEDWIGLRTLDEKGKLYFINCPTLHLGFSEKWFHYNIWVPHMISNVTV